MFNYISISILFLSLFSFSALGQDEKKSDLPNYPKTRGIAIGVDLSPLILQWADPSRRGLNFLGRMNVTENWYLAAECSYEKYAYTSERFDYNSKGMGFKLGADYNVFNPHEANNNDNVFFGFRYGLAQQTHGSKQYTIQNGYWSDYSGSYATYNVTSHYFELLTGLRAEVFKNFFMGVSVRARSLIYTSNNDILEPSTIPGYGKPLPLNFGFSYTLEYQIPLQTGKKQQQPTAKK